MPTTELLEAQTSPAELVARRQDGQRLALLDVRTPSEFQTEHVPGSENVPLDQLASVRDQIRSDLTWPVVLICPSGTRARQAQRLLAEANTAAVEVLDGGLAAWQAAGLPVVRGRARWGLERQVRAIAGALVLAGTLGSLLVWPPLIFLAVFVGAGLLFAGLTDFCGMALLLARLPYNRAGAVNPRESVARLAQAP